MTDDELSEYSMLQERFGDLLRDGSIDVDGEALDGLATPSVDELRAVLATPGLPATWLARHLDSWQRSGFVVDPGIGRGRLRSLVRVGAAFLRRLPDRSSSNNQVRPTNVAADIVSGRDVARQQAISPPRVIPGTVTTTPFAPRSELIRGLC